MLVSPASPTLLDWLSQIFTDLYGTKFENEEAFVSNAQQIIKNLFNISIEIPSEQFLNLAGSNSNMSLRIAASLHLMLYQVRTMPGFSFRANIVSQFRQLCWLYVHSCSA